MGIESSAKSVWFVALTTYIGYAVLIAFGHVRDFIGSFTGRSRYNSGPARKGYAPLLQNWEDFYTRRLYHRIQDCWNRPIEGAPVSGKMKVVQRRSQDGNVTMEPLSTTRTCVNLGSYNYLGFADDWHKTCRPDVMKTLAAWPISMCASFGQGGYTSLHRQLEKDVASFLGKDDAIVYNMGFATNFLGLPSLASKGTLIVSDSLNHTSIVYGARHSGATIKVYKHHDYVGLESILRQAIVDGQDRTHRPWKKLIIVVEGIYSMEGETVDLPAVVALAKRYKAYVYLDEAHSIGALGKTGRGVCEQLGVPTSDVDIMMGTFTKSFGAMGGYIAGSSELISAIRASSAGFLVDNAMSPVVCQQVLTAFKVIKGEDGTSIGRDKLKKLHDNANYFRQRLIDMGCDVLGVADSPVIPLMIFNPTKLASFSRACLERGVASVVVAFPATPLLLGRARFCISAGHTREDLDFALAQIDEVAGEMCLRYCRSTTGS